jgi:integrase/recombinase XerD
MNNRYHKSLNLSRRSMKNKLLTFPRHSKQHQLTLSQALEGYHLHAEARRLSLNTIRDYFTTFSKFQLFFEEDIPLADISVEDVELFLASLDGLKKKTVLNYYVGLSALWTWAFYEGVVEEHIIRQIIPPNPKKAEIIPFTLQDVRLIIAACERSRSYRRPGQLEQCNHSLPYPERNKAIVLLLLDTGLRASEVCNSKIANIDLRNKRMTVIGKGNKQRTVPFSAKTGKRIWRYLATRRGYNDRDPLFASNDGGAIDRHSLRRFLNRLGQRADVRKVYPHRFRHTFAINFLRNGGDIYTLQYILGHSTLEMVKRYLKLAEQDTENSHRIASPVANWNL